MEILGDFTPSVIRALSEIDPDFEQYDALVITGSHNPHDVDEYVEKIKEARLKQRPYFGECWGHQLAAIEYARNILNIKDANSEENGTGTYVIKKRNGLKVGLHDGESYWSNYDVAIGWEKPDYFFTAPYHASYQSSLGKPHPLIQSFLKLCKKQHIVADGRRV